MSISALSIGDPLVKPSARFDPIVVRAFETRTGRVAAIVPFVGQPTWSRGLNSPGSWSVTVPLDTADISSTLLDGITDPWRFSWAVCQGSKIWQAGPVVSESYQGGESTTFRGGGLLKLLTDKRLLINPGRASLAGAASVDADVAFGPTSPNAIGSLVPAANQNLSLHTIAKRVCETIELAPGGDLPINYPADIAGTSERSYPGYDLAYVGKRLLELTQVIDGPEIEFTPEFVDSQSKQFIRWTMRIGNSRLGNLTFRHYWDDGKALINTMFDKDGSYRITRDFERGNGMNRDLVSGFADQPINSNPSDLLLENAGAEHTSALDPAVLNGWAAAVVASGRTGNPILTHLVRVPGDDGYGYQTRSPVLSEVEVGDNCTAVLTKHPRLPDGAYACRITDISSTPTPLVAQLTTQFLGMV